ADPDGAASEIAEQISRQLGSTPAKAATFFATAGHGPGLGRFERALRAAAGTEHVIGCSASGVLSRDGEVERGPGVAALAVAGESGVRGVFFWAPRGRSGEAGRELGRAARDLEREPKTVLVLADSYNLVPDELLAGVAAVAPGIPVVGAGATEDGSFGETM